MISPIKAFFKSESSGGMLLIMASVVAMVLANSTFSSYYSGFLETPFSVAVGDFALAKPIYLWINDGLMAIFFLLVGLELKRELIEGELSDPKNIALPAIGALGGMAIPALIYVGVNLDNPRALDGWAIPAATDIAFALGILSLLGSRVPVSLKIFLTSIAIFDDVGAILIIAFFYTAKISLLALIVSGICTALLIICNRSGVTSLRVYCLIGVVLWIALLKSGVHATLAGVVIALTIPIESDPDRSEYTRKSPLKYLEHQLHSPVAYLILPVFAFANSGVNFAGMTMDSVLHGVPVGIALGLFFGKQLGVFGFCWLGVKLKLARMPSDMSYLSLYGIALLCGIGFTMSLFIGSLAFGDSNFSSLFDERVGIITGSVISALCGYFVLKYSLARMPADPKVNVSTDS